jgi:hypothetical protein
MLVLLVVLLLLLGVGLVRRYRARERRKELLWMKRHAADYVEQHKSA